MPASDRLIKGSRFVVRTGLIVNRVFLFAVILGLLSSFLFAAQIGALLLHQDPGVDVRSEMNGLRWLMVLGIAEAVGTELLLRALTQIVASAGTGDPFVFANARRLQTIGSSLLALQLLDIPGALIDRFFPSLGTAAPGVTFSPGGWIAVLMVFVLSRVFAAGSVMREELEGTV